MEIIKGELEGNNKEEERGGGGGGEDATRPIKLIKKSTISREIYCVFPIHLFMTLKAHPRWSRLGHVGTH